METRKPHLVQQLTAVDVTTWLPTTVSFLLQGPSIFCTCEMESSGDVVGTIGPVSFKLQSLQKYDIAFVHYFPEKQVNNFHGLSNHNSLHFVDQGTNVSILLTSTFTYPHYTFEY